jgi:dTDP-4-dehydrorhamnose reductase
MRILLTGANGQVGRELTSCAIQKGFDILALSHGALDITDPTAVHRKVGQSDVSLVVNAAAYTDVDQAESEPDLAFRVNRDGPANLASACTEARLLSIFPQIMYSMVASEDRISRQIRSHLWEFTA